MVAEKSQGELSLAIVHSIKSSQQSPTNGENEWYGRFILVHLPEEDTGHIPSLENQVYNGLDPLG